MAVLPPPTIATRSPMSGFSPVTTARRKSMPPHTPLRSSPLTRIAVDFHAPFATITASNHERNFAKSASRPILKLLMKLTPSASMASVSALRIALGRRYSGMP